MMDFMTADEAIADITDNPAYASLSAVKNNKVFSVNLNEVYCSGVRTYDGIMTFAKHCIQICTNKMKRNRILKWNFSWKPIYVLAVILLAVFLVISILTAVTIGSVDLSVKDVYSVILYKLFGIGDPEVYGVGAMSDIVWFIRLPRILLATAVGMGLAVAGVVMQAIVKNPIADPYILGISSGASLGATVAIFLGVGAVFGSNSIGICAFIGAFLISVLVQITANIGGRANSVRLLLAGTALWKCVQCNFQTLLSILRATEMESRQLLSG